ncbi:MAG: hypothetical protein AB1486_11435 [Planctomycetota bacterium]
MVRGLATPFFALLVLVVGPALSAQTVERKLYPVRRSRTQVRSSSYAPFGPAPLVLVVGPARSAQTVERKLYTYDDIPNFPWSGWMGSSGGTSLTLDLRCTSAPASGVYCARVLFDGSESWAGIYVQSSDGNWTGPGINLCAKELSFKYRGSPAGASMEIRVFNDQRVFQHTLQSSWQTATISLAGLACESIYNIFAVVLRAPGAKTVDLDDIAITFERPQSEAPVHVQLQGEGAPAWTYELLVDGEPFFARGIGYNVAAYAAYAADFAMMAEARANALRLWSQADATFATLDAAEAAGLKVFIGYWLPRGDEGGGPADYTDATFCQAVKNSVANWIACYRDHPAVLVWVLGNEVLFFLDPPTPENKEAFVALLDALADQVHSSDPHHLVSHADVELLSLDALCSTSIDIYGANSFESAEADLVAYDSAGCDKPLALLEVACDGWWARDWNQYDDLERALDYGRRVVAVDARRGMTVGAFAFAWRDKTEDAYTGWGLVDADRRPRPQLRAVNAVYLSEALSDAAARIHLNQDHYQAGDPLELTAFLANSREVSRDADLCIVPLWGASAGGSFGARALPSWENSLLLPPNSFAILTALSTKWLEATPGTGRIAGALAEPGTFEWIGGRDGLHFLSFTLGGGGARLR